MRSEGRLGEQEIEVGDARFAAGDQVITRVNDRANDIYNRERWLIAEVDAEKRRIVLDGIDQARTVGLGPDYLTRTTLGGDVPALQHAYAVTTYCAQGTTVDRAYVMADSSMDKQEFYVATSRSREETYLYATPEIQAERNEYAPKPPERDAIGNIAEAAERDRVQTAAHDEALRSELRQLPTQEIAARREALDTPARGEAREEHEYARQRQAVESRVEQYERAVANREAVEALGWRERRQKLPYARESEELLRDRLDENVAKLERMEPPGAALRREHAIADQLLAEREERMLTAARLSPPSYVVKELGERPSDPAKGKAWDRGVKEIEGYRQEHGVTDKQRALGREPQSASQQAAREAARRRLRESQRRLGREQQLTQERKLRRSIERGFSLGR
jgi:hypothetical protein